jgi:hypothetical protein
MNSTTTLRNVGYSIPNETFQKTDFLRDLFLDNYEAVKKGGGESLGDNYSVIAQEPSWA